MRRKQLLYDLFQAYYDARTNKRNTINALKFEIDYEKKLFELCEEITTQKYRIGQSVCFISFYPLRREIFAAGFRDRVVHHLIYNYISPVFEKLFINDTYSCRSGKGTLYGIKRLSHFIRSCSENYKNDCYILKLDIKGYFMSIDKEILYAKLEKILKKHKEEIACDFNLLMALIRQIVFHNPVKNCLIRGKKDDWLGLPKSKSLFYAGPGKGLPIGNLTSQLFGNVYLNDFDHFVKRRLGCRYYCRYVDDVAIVHKNKGYLKYVMQEIRKYLENELCLLLHPNKIYLQHFSKGAQFLGVIIKPHRFYICNKTKGNFYKKIQYWNNLAGKKEGLSKESAQKILAGANSYLGIMKHCDTYKLRKRVCCAAIGGGGLYMKSFLHRQIMKK